MNMRRFIVEDIAQVNSWYRARAMPTVSEHLFPDIGMIVDGIGAGFIYQTDSSMCFLDGYISNPETTREERAEAFDKISHALILTAKEYGFSQILAYTKNSEIRKRCERFGFTARGEHTLYVKGI